MALYVILRQTRELPPSPFDPVTIKYFPINDPSGEPLTLEAENAEAAFAGAKELFPYLAHFLAVQPLQEY